MRQWIGRLLLGLSWLLAMAELMLGLDGLLFGRAELSEWFILGGASMAGTLTVTAAEEIATGWRPKAELDIEIRRFVASSLPYRASTSLAH